MSASPGLDVLPGLIGELEDADQEHPDVSVGHESGWVLSVSSDLTLVWENVDHDGQPLHTIASSKAEAIGLCLLVAIGKLDMVAGLAWEAGYPR